MFTAPSHTLRRLALAAVTTGLLIAGSSTASAADLSCGDVITHSTTLHSDLDCSAGGPGLVIGANDVTLDLNGHTIIGDSEPFASYDTGVSNSDGHAGVTIENGSIHNFELGVVVENARGNLIKDVSLSGFDTGIKVHFSTRTTIIGNDTSGFAEGVELLKTNSSVVDDNSLSDNGFLGIKLWFSNNNVVRGNTVDGNGEGGGIALAGASGNLVAGNEETGSPFDGIHVESDFDFFRGRVAPADGNQVLGNETSGNQNGISVGGFATRNNRIAGNSSHHNLGGILVIDGPNGTIVSGNTTNHNSGDEDGLSQGGFGVDIEAASTNTLVAGNTADYNAGDGVLVRNPTTRLRDNTANFNGGLGFEAEYGVRDLGNNTATGNANPDQCVNVACG